MVREDILIRKDKRAGRLTLNRPEALNAVTADMLVRAEEALDNWRADPSVDLVVLDAVGSKAFCAGGDIAELYGEGRAGNHQYGRDFWWQEYRLNLKIATYPKPVVVFLQGLTLGGGVGFACHGSHRIVGESSVIAMPECGIGLIPDVGGSYLLGRAPGAVGEYLGLTGARMKAKDSIFATFADHHVPEMLWSDLIMEVTRTGDLGSVLEAKTQPTAGVLEATTEEIDTLFSGETLLDIAAALASRDSDFAREAAAQLAKGAPLAQACGLQAIRAAKGGTLEQALRREYRFTARATEHGDFLEGIRAQIIDRDFAPVWLHNSKAVPQEDINRMMARLGDEEWEAGEATI